MKFNMYEFALMSRFIELGKRYGLEPWEFGVEYDRASGEAYFTGGPAGGEAHARFTKMAAALGSDGSAIPLVEGPETLAALDAAISHAPKTWAR
jgi:hypothetical protein